VRSSPRTLLLAAGGAAAAAAAVWFVAFQTATGQRFDARALDHLRLGHESRARPFVHGVNHLADPLPFALCVAGIVAIALARGRPRLACAAAVALVAANLTTEILKRLTEDPRDIALVPYAHVATASWPSGHTTAAVMLGLWLVVVAPPALRPLAIAVGAAFALAIAGSVVLLASHFPSDVAGAVCVAAAWTLAGLAAVAAGAPSPGRRRASASPSPS
jgi:membrane-associated phospholipid phosphatase